MRTRLRFGAFLAAGLVVLLALAFLVSPQASSQPDGLNRVAIDEGFDDTEEVHALDGLPTAGYSVRGVGDDALSTGLAGGMGAAATFAVVGGVLLLVRRSSSSAPGGGHEPS